MKSVYKLLHCPFCCSEAKLKITEGYGDYDYDKLYYDVKCTND